VSGCGAHVELELHRQAADDYASVPEAAGGCEPGVVELFSRRPGGGAVADCGAIWAPHAVLHVCAGNVGSRRGEPVDWERWAVAGSTDPAGVEVLKRIFEASGTFLVDSSLVWASQHVYVFSHTEKSTLKEYLLVPSHLTEWTAVHSLEHFR